MALTPPTAVSSLTTWRAALLAIALLAPLNLPFSIPNIDQVKIFGWSSTADAPEGAPVVTRTMRGAREAGLMPGDRLLFVDEQPATPASIASARAAAAAGDLLRLTVERRGQRVLVAVPVDVGSASYMGFMDYIIALALASWLTGVAVVAWRGARLDHLLLGAALLLVPPSLFPSGVPGSGVVLSGARLAWQSLCVGYAVFLPAFMLHYLWTTAAPRRARSRPGWWLTFYLALVAALAAMTSGFTDPFDASKQPWEHHLRTGLGTALCILTLGAALLLLWRQRTTSMSERAMQIAIGAASLTSAAQISVLGWAPNWQWAHVVGEMDTLTLFLLPCMVAFHLFVPSSNEESDWKQQRWLATSASLVVTMAYAIAICGTVAMVLHVTGRELGGVQWLLFVAILGSTIALSAPLRFVREMVDRRLLAHWVRQERRARTFVDHVATILEPERIAGTVAAELPALLGVQSAELIFVRETAEAWGVSDHPELTLRGGAEVAREFAHSGSAESGGTTAVPVLMPDGALIAALLLVPQPDSPSFSDFDREVVRTVVQGLATALGNARSYLRLHRTQQKLSEAEQIAVVGAMASGLAHEIKNPLASLQMGLFLLERDGANPGKIQRIRADVSRIDDLVVGLRRYVNGEVHDTPELLDVCDVTRACVADVRPRAADRGASIVEAYPDGPALARGSLEQFRLVIRNLIGNAVDSLPEDGTIMVEVKVSDRDVRLSVTDDGAGIPDDIRDRVFELHFSTKPGGTGLGLALARRETTRLGGTIQLEPHEGPGTRLSVTLPRMFA